MPDVYRVIMSPEASANLLAAYTYIAQDSPQNAATMIERLLDAIDGLESLPHRYHVIQRGRQPKRGARLMPVPPYRVYYRILEDEKVVRVVAIDHGSRRRRRSVP